MVIRGGCMCGDVRYECDGAPFDATICHCESCRRAAGATQVAWVTLPKASFRFVGREPSTYRSSARALRGFCGRCGTSLTFEADALPDDIDVTIGSLDDPGALAPKDHVHVEEKIGWTVLGDGLPTYPAGRSAS